MKKLVLTIFTLLVLALVLCASGCRKRKCGDPRGNCICTQEYAPVCGENNITYGNACEAECAGVTKYRQGACN